MILTACYYCQDFQDTVASDVETLKINKINKQTNIIALTASSECMAMRGLSQVQRKTTR